MYVHTPTMSADKRDALLGEARQHQAALATLRDELRSKAQSMEAEYINPSLPGDGRGEVSDSLLAALTVSSSAGMRRRDHAELTRDQLRYPFAPDSMRHSSVIIFANLVAEWT